jgi:serine/threonine protein kinase
MEFIKTNEIDINETSEIWEVTDGNQIAVLKIRNYDFVEEFLTEVRILGELAHENIIKLITARVVFEQKPLLFECHMIIEKGDCDLRQYRRNITPTWAQFVNIYNGVLAGLVYLHGVGYLHGDIKPENIVLSSGGVPKIIDFEHASKCDDDDNIHKIGTIPFIPPEIITRKRYSEKVDYWEFGTTMFYLATGKFLFDIDEFYETGIVDKHGGAFFESDSSKTDSSESSLSTNDSIYEDYCSMLRYMEYVLGECPCEIKQSPFYKGGNERQLSIRDLCQMHCPSPDFAPLCEYLEACVCYDETERKLILAI